MIYLQIGHSLSNSMVLCQGDLVSHNCLFTALENWTVVYSTPRWNSDWCGIPSWKAFDCPHKCLLEKFQAHGIMNKLLNWIKGTHGRKQRVYN